MTARPAPGSREPGAHRRSATWREPRSADPFAGDDVPDEIVIHLVRDGRFYRGGITTRQYREAKVTRASADGRTWTTNREYSWAPPPPQAHGLSVECRRRPVLPQLMKAVSRALWARAEGMEMAPVQLPGQLAFDLPDLGELPARHPR
jgi:hypothetical protein